jgi:hypothetical protein
MGRSSEAGPVTGEDGLYVSANVALAFDDGANQSDRRLRNAPHQRTRGSEPNQRSQPDGVDAGIGLAAR